MSSRPRPQRSARSLARRAAQVGGAPQGGAERRADARVGGDVLTAGGVGAGWGAVETGSQPGLGPCALAQPGTGTRGPVSLELWSRSVTGPGSVRRR